MDLGLLIQDCGAAGADAPLTLDAVSALYRRAALAKALKLKVKDFLALKGLSGQDPFGSPRDTLRFAELSTIVTGSGMGMVQLAYIVGHISAPGAHDDLTPRDATIADLARRIRDGLSAIVGDNVFASDPTGTLTTGKLALLYQSELVEELARIVSGTASYSAPLIVLPAGVTLPPALAKKIAFDPIAQQLSCKAPLTTADRGALSALSSDAAYLAAVGSLYQQPLEVIKTIVGVGTGSFLDLSEAQRRVVTESPSLGADLSPILLDARGQVTTDPARAQTTVIAAKFEYILRNLLPFLIERLSSSLVKRLVADALKIPDLIAQKLLDVLLRSRLKDSRAAVLDCQSLATQGLSSAYHISADLSGDSSAAVVATVAYDGNKSVLTKGIQSASWTGRVAPTASGDFEFIVRTNGAATLYVDDQNTALTLVPSDGAVEFTSAKVTLKAGQLYYLRLDITKLPTEKAQAQLLWQSASVRKSIIPAANLFPAANLRAFHDTYIRLQKASLIVSVLKLTADELEYLCRKDSRLPRLDLNSLPIERVPLPITAADPEAARHVAALARAADYVRFRRKLAPSDVKLTDLFAASTLDEAIKSLIAITGWDPGVVGELIGDKGFSLSLAEFGNEAWPMRLLDCVQLGERLGVSGGYLFQWATSASDFATLERIGQEVKKCVQGQYEAEAWLAVAKPLNDKLREAQRQALVAYLLPRMGLNDSDQLFEYFLIDADMGVCTQTSRISLAHSSVQLFVQRCLMNLEETGGADSVSPHQIDADQWEKWRKHYRYWQANYEVLLNPENWMEQGLRDDKTPFFKALEGDLTQQEISTENVETAYLNYLEKLEQVARLEVIGSFWQDKDPDTGDAVNTLHVFGRTFHSPHTYFYRTQVNFTTWTPWEQMQVTIEGDHVMPLIWNRRLYLFWPIFSKKSVPPETNSIDTSSKHIPLKGPQTHWQVALAWTELRHNKWTAKQVSKKAFDMDPGYFVDDHPARYSKYAYSFKTSIARDVDGTASSLILRCVFHGPTVRINLLSFFFLRITIRETTEVVGAFEVGGCSGESVEPHFGTMPWPNPLTPPGTEVEALTYVSSPGKSGLTLLKAANQQPTSFLGSTPTPYRLQYPHQYSDYLLQAPFFYQDKHRVFFAVPHEEHGPVRQINNVQHASFQRGGAASAARSHAATTHSAIAKGAATAKHSGDRAPLHAASGEPSKALLELENAFEILASRIPDTLRGEAPLGAATRWGTTRTHPVQRKSKWRASTIPLSATS